ncbi:alkaline phosphatase family protein [Empedobacter falsenii]|uniref:alkaline phosphatase family protein n=1 Tax=Empedobacter falsenii TaxID=343874 RepID=UPI002578C505|nr:alkaline phosphatase family protein [Empedobacter falsenii]MDM1298669.1 alkaline phosphatase family protein [Empedobacter falsenii]MDM1318462.1 alkaline phosphatase family protein [Empedobacter falsenii]
MKYTFLILALCSNFLFAQEPKVILVTLDGVRWKEVFRGVEKSILNDKKYNSLIVQTNEKYWTEDSIKRRELLMPFTWKTIKEKGVILGNRDEQNFVNLTNKRLWSYPGYNEIITGKADDERIKNNKDIPNPNVSVFEIANQQKNLNNKVMAFGSWRMYTNIFNQERSKLLVNAGYQNSFNQNKSERELLIERFQLETPKQWWGTRFDIFTHEFALEAMKNQKPNLLFIGYGEADDYGHDEDYDQYITSINRNDRMIEELWNYVQSDPFYKDQTTIIVTTDHGRGNGNEWTDHNDEVKGSDEGFILMIGNGINPKNFKQKQTYLNQIASTIADLMKVKTWNYKDSGKSLLK